MEEFVARVISSSSGTFSFNGVVFCARRGVICAALSVLPGTLLFVRGLLAREPWIVCRANTVTTVNRTAAQTWFSGA